jgi:hypothetical protein
MTPGIDYMPIDNLHQHILHYAAAAVRICLPILMDVLPSVNADDATTSEAVKTQAKKWSDQEIEDLVDFLYNRRSEASSPGNFKPVVWTAAKLHLDTKHPHSDPVGGSRLFHRSKGRCFLGIFVGFGLRLPARRRFRGFGST